MTYVHILQSVVDAERYYFGLTDDLRNRLPSHNAAVYRTTSKYRPWRLNTYVAFSDKNRAVLFEQYLKTGSGRAFSRKAALIYPPTQSRNRSASSMGCG